MLEPELLADVEPDIHLVTTLVSLARVIPTRTRQTARWVVRRFISHPFDGAQRVVQWNPCLNVPGMRNRSARVSPDRRRRRCHHAGRLAGWAVLGVIARFEQVWIIDKPPMPRVACADEQAARTTQASTLRL